GPMRADERSWAAGLSGIPWDREPHELTVAVRARGPASPSFLKRQKVRYVPGPPRLRPRIPQHIGQAFATGLEVDDRRFRFAADVELTRDEKARVRLICRHGDEVLRRVESGPEFAGQPRIDATLELKPGDNTIE